MNSNFILSNSLSLSLQDIISLLSNVTETFTFASKIKNGTVRLSFPSTTAASLAIKKLNTPINPPSTCSNISVTYCQSNDSLLFIGNFPFWYNRDRLYDLYSPYGTILRCFVVYSMSTDISKGYGFVEFSTKQEALLAKQMTATRVVSGRSLRVEFAEASMATCEDLHSKTLFVDKLPKGMSDETKLINLFSQFGTVEFCQVSGCVCKVWLEISLI